MAPAIASVGRVLNGRGSGSRGRGGLVIDGGRRRLISGRGSRHLGTIAVIIHEDVFLSSVSETPLAEADIRKTFDVAESHDRRLTRGSKGDHIGH